MNLKQNIYKFLFGSPWLTVEEIESQGWKIYENQSHVMSKCWIFTKDDKGLKHYYYDGSGTTQIWDNYGTDHSLNLFLGEIRNLDTLKYISKLIKV